jgi:hypothetical protein
LCLWKVHLPRQELRQCKRYILDADQEEMRGADGAGGRLVQAHGDVSLAAGGKKDVAGLKPIRFAPACQGGFCHRGPINARAGTNVLNLDNGSIAARDVPDSVSDWVARRDGGQAPKLFRISSHH